MSHIVIKMEFARSSRMITSVSLLRILLVEVALSCDEFCAQVNQYEIEFVITAMNCELYYQAEQCCWCV